MSYANGTTHYNLPQTVGTDKRDWFDTNEAFADVDAALHTASETASGAASDIVALGGRVTDLETASGTQAQDIVDIKADVLTQGQAITRLDGEIDDVKADALDMICAIDEGTAQVATVPVNEGEFFRYNDVLYIATDNIAIGDTIVPNTNCRATNVATELQGLSAPSASEVSYDNTSSGMTADDVQEAIDELKSDLDNGNTDASKFVSVTSNGSETRSQLFDRLHAVIDFTKITKNPLIEFNGIKRFCEIEGTTVKATLSNCSTTFAAINTITCIASSSTIYDVQIASGSVTFTNESSTVLTAGIVAKFIY